MNTVFPNETAASVQGAKIYEEGEGRELEIPEARFENTETRVMTGSPVRALYGGTVPEKVTMLDAGAFMHPAAGFEKGNMGQEEMLCSESNLFNILQQLDEPFYRKNRAFYRGGLFTDRALFVPDVAFSRNGEMRTANVELVAAPNRNRAIDNIRGTEECNADLKRRIETIFRIAAANETDLLIVNAFGCGGLGNDPEMVADLYERWLSEHPGVFQTVIFSIGRGPAEEVFERHFGATEKKARTAHEPKRDDQDDDDDSFLDGLELPDGITLR
ncbi:MAG: TIGR02452 family protein [Coriobacteriales bacterium]